MEKFNIILADDHKMFAEGVRFILGQEPDMHILGEAADGLEAIELLRQNPHADLLILDLEMPNVNGVEVMKKVRKEYPGLRTLILTYHNEGDFIYNLHRMGANGYVIKNSGGEALLNAIRSIMKAQNRPFPPMNTWEQKSQPWQEEDIRLTKREREVLDLSDLSREEIAGRLKIKVFTVDTHLENLRHKFGVESTPKLTRKAIRLGFIEP
ncbi:MAG: response regulator transcription factor [Lewinellaceae bacterium]|nr:response regulator transcription factor [Lewinellaceae bacterium]